MAEPPRRASEMGVYHCHNLLAVGWNKSERPAMDSAERIPVQTGNGEPDIERDEQGRAYWAENGARITWADVIECDEDGEVKEVLIDLLIRNGLWVLREGREALVTRDGIELWPEEM